MRSSVQHHSVHEIFDSVGKWLLISPLGEKGDKRIRGVERYKGQGSGSALVVQLIWIGVQLELPTWEVERTQELRTGVSTDIFRFR